MAVVILDVDSDSEYYDQLTELSGREYLFTFYWNTRASLWFMDVADQDENLIAGGIAIVCGIALARRVIDERIWPGTMMAYDTSSANTDPGRNDLGTRVLLVYDDGEPL